jgi:hypothetical protein
MRSRIDFARCDRKHKKAEVQTAKPSALGSQRLCLVPHTRRFLGRQSLGAELAVKVMLVSGYFTFRPHTSFRGNEDGQSDRQRLLIARRLFCGLPCPQLGKRRPRQDGLTTSSLRV